MFGRNVIPAVPALPSMVGNPVLKGMKIPDTQLDIVQSDFDVFDGRIYMVAYRPSSSGNAVNPHYWDDGATANTMVAVPEGDGKAFYIRTYKTKIYGLNGNGYLFFSAIKQPKAWNVGSTILDPDGHATTGMGFVNLGMDNSGSERLTGLEVYYDKLAVFSTQSILIRAVDPDPLQDATTQILSGSGTYAARSPLQYGSGDVLFLDHSGVRSMKARDSSNSASVSDIGSPIDSILSQLEISLGTGFMAKAVSVLEPYVGRFWLCLPDRVYVLSYFPGPKVSAWSQFTLPFTMQHVVRCAGRIFFRDTANQLWVYGGTTGEVYENCGVEIRLPYLDGKKPGHRKQFLAFDATISGAWDTRVSFDYNNPDNEEVVASLGAPSWNDGRVEMVGNATHFSLRFYNSDDQPATISNCAAHYEMADAEA